MRWLQIIVSVGLLGCGDDAPADVAPTPAENREAAQLIARNAAVDAFASFVDRRTRIADLEELPLESPQLRAVQRTCVEAHRALLDAEVLQSEVAATIAPYEENDTRIPAEISAQLEAKLADSNRNFDRARTMLPQCDEQIGALARRQPNSR